MIRVWRIRVGGIRVPKKLLGLRGLGIRAPKKLLGLGGLGSGGLGPLRIC